MNRGGLWHIRENTHSFFSCLEVRIHLQSLLNEANKKQKIIQELDNENVQFYWLIVGTDFEEDNQEVHSELLKRIVELFVTMRGFSYASAWLEKYEQVAKKRYPKIKEPS